MLRRWRIIGATVGLATCFALAVSSLAALTVNAMLFSIAVGYGVSALLAELALLRARGGSDRTVATARPRTLRSVVSWWSVAPAGLTLGIVVAALIVAALWRPDAEAVAIGERLSPRALAIAALGVAFVAFVAAVAVRWLATAPERAGDPWELVVQRASRLVAIMTVTGAAWMVFGVIGTAVMRSLFAAGVAEPWNWVRVVASIYVALSAPMGFIATLSALPRRGGGRLSSDLSGPTHTADGHA